MTELGTKTKKQASDFYELVKGIIQTEDYRRMRQYRHHLHGSTFEHSIKVAYLCYKHHLKHKSKVPLEELIRAALLHDYFLYDHHSKKDANGKTGLKHIVQHPRRALENAKAAYPDLTRAEQNAIKRHMFPLTPIPPTTRCAWLVCYYDKVAAIGDYCNKVAWKQELKPCFSLSKAVDFQN